MGFSMEEILAMRVAFDAIDGDGDEKIERGDVGSLLRNLGFHPSPRDVEVSSIFCRLAKHYDISPKPL